MESLPLFERRDDPNIEDLAGKRGLKKQYTAHSVLITLPDEGGLSTAEWQKRTEIATGMKEQSFVNHRSDLVKQGLVWQQKKGAPWQKTAKGVELSRKILASSAATLSDKDTDGELAPSVEEADELLRNLDAEEDIYGDWGAFFMFHDSFIWDEKWKRI
jgi:hypothetical protein